ncbi:MAG: hypothetical protein EXS32_12475 [Opitutus sp.]|nr:hypothetical protein [Opitutus sp.]
MIRQLLTLLRDTPDRRRLVLFGLTAALAVIAGFLSVTPKQAEDLIGAGGYYYMFALFGAFVFFGGRVLAERRAAWGESLGASGAAGVVVVVGASAFAIWCDPFAHKILFDEYVLQGTAFHLHATKEIGTVIRAYDIWGTWQPIDTFLDKRPYFFTFLVSLVHDFTGYRVANAFILNAALAPVLLTLVYWLGRTLAGRGPAMLTVALLGTMPLLGQQASGAGMELHNLTMLALLMVIATLYLRAPSPDRLSLLVLGAVLLAQSRYESVIFVVPVAAVIVAGWRRLGHVFLPWPAIFAPLLLVPYAWHNRVLSATPLLWQLHEGQTSRFGLNYLASNLEGARNFFFNFSPSIPNSWYLSILGTLAGGWALAAAGRWARSSARAPLAPEILVLVVFGGGMAGNLALLMFYYWSRLDDVIASRFALPMCLLLALLVALLLRRLDDWRPAATRWAAAGLGVWLLTWCIPALARHTYTSQNLVMQEVEWEHVQLLRHPGPLLFISNKSTIPFVLWRIPTIINGVGRQRAAHIKYHLKEGTFREVIIAQALRPTSPEGEMGVDPEDLMPATYRLEPFAEKRFGGRYARLSRLVGIDDLPVPPPTVAPKLADATP